MACPKILLSRYSVIPANGHGPLAITKHEMLSKHFLVIPEKAGVRGEYAALDSGLRGNDDRGTFRSASI